MVDMKRNYKKCDENLEASGIYRENLSDMCMWGRNIMIAMIVNFIMFLLIGMVIAIIMLPMIKTSIRN